MGLFSKINPQGLARIPRVAVANKLGSDDSFRMQLKHSQRLNVLLDWKKWRQGLLDFVPGAAGGGDGGGGAGAGGSPPPSSPSSKKKAAADLDFEVFHAFFSNYISTHPGRQAELAAQAAKDKENDVRSQALQNNVQYKRMKAAFDLIDADGGGTLDTRELLAAVKDEETVEAMLAACPALAPIIDPAKWFKSFMTIPMNADGEVTFAGFRQFCETLEAQEAKARQAIVKSGGRGDATANGRKMSKLGQ